MNHLGALWHPLLGYRIPMLPLLVLLACHTTPVPQAVPVPAVAPADVAPVVAAMGLTPWEEAAPLAIRLGTPTEYPGYSVVPLSFEPWPGFRTSAALWRPEGEGPFPGVLVLPGHFGEGKAAGECQEVAHALAARGYATLALDMPGLEEWDVPGRQLHFEAGAFHRGALLAAGSSALGLQVGLARRGLDALQAAAPVDHLAATGASGGAVLSVYLALADPRVEALIAASWVPIPRLPDGGGCYCDVLAGHPGPEPALLAALTAPSLWLAEDDRPPPEGLPASARFAVVPGPHSYTAAMRAVALPWLDTTLGHTPPDPVIASEVLIHPPYTPGDALRSSTDEGAISLLDLALARGGPRDWTPTPLAEEAYTIACTGQGPAVLTAGADAHDQAALFAAGLQACAVDLAPDETWELRTTASGHALVDVPAGALRHAAADIEPPPLGVYAAGPWAVAAAASGLPTVLRDPLRDPHAADLPAWANVPGGWWGGLDTLYAGVLAVGDDPAALIEALRGQQSHPSPASESSTPSQSPGGE